MRIYTTKVLSLGLLIALLGPSPASAYPRPGTTERVSLTAEGLEIGASVTSPAISDDGRFVAFVTMANGVVPGDNNNMYDVFVRDRATNTTEQVSVGSDGLVAKAMALSPQMSSDGRYVLFVSSAGFDPRDTNKTWDPYIRDRVAGTTSLGAVGPDDKSVEWGAGDGHMSDDARIVTFATGSKLLPEDDNGTFDVHAYNRETGTLELVSATPSGASANGESYYNDISSDGRYAVFYSFASNVLPNDTNGATDVFVRDLVADKTIRVSVSSDGTEGNAGSILPDISEDGRYVSFVSYASNLVPADSNPINDVFVHDLVTRRTERVSIASDGTEPNLGLSSSWAPSISGDGRYVAFASSASNLVPGDTNGVGDYFVHDRHAASTDRVSIASDGTQMSSNNSSAAPEVGAGRFVAFTSNAPNLVPGDQNADYDVFVRDRGPALGAGRFDALRTGEEISLSGWATFSGETIAGVTDDDRDGRRPAPGISAGAIGAELIGAGVTYRPEAGDLVIRWDVTKLPGIAGPSSGVDLNSLASGGLVPSVSGAPAVLYGLELRAGGARFEVRALRAGASAAPPGVPMFGLYRCEQTCTEARRLQGSFGTAGEGLRAVVPVAALGVSEGQPLTDLRAFSALGESAPGALQPLDDVTLGAVVLPIRSLAVGISEGPVRPQTLPFSIPVTGDDPAFAVTFRPSGVPEDAHLWLRTCLGEVCEFQSRAL